MGPQEEVKADVHEVEHVTQDDLLGHDAEDRTFLQINPGDIFLNNLKPPERLGSFTVVCIICNRVIGKEPHLNHCDHFRKQIRGEGGRLYGASLFAHSRQKKTLPLNS